MDKAEAYCRLARIAVEMATSGQQLRNWWRNETVRRHQHGLSAEQEAELTTLCRVRVQELTPMAA